MKLLLNILFLVTVSTSVFAENPDSIDHHYYSSPVKIPIFLAGNFAELRPNHFHGGIDIKTQGRTKIPIYAAADGYVARINISPLGYGNALYINHPNGTTTVYGHLDSFAPQIEEYIRNIQYEKEQFAVDQNIEEGVLPVAKGEQIALSGNSGSSAGPHLHFEIRRTKEEIQLNPLMFNMPVKDKTKPTIQALMVYPVSENGLVSGKKTAQRFDVILAGTSYKLKVNQVIPVSGKIGFGLQSIDLLDGSANKCGIYSLKLSVDNTVIYSFKMDEVALNESKYVNSHMDYSIAMRTGTRLYRTWLEPGNHLNIYKHVENSGILDAEDGKKHLVNFEIADANGNLSNFSFSVQSKANVVQPKEPSGKIFKYNHDNRIKNDALVFSVPEGALYSDIEFQYQEKTALPKFYSPTYQLHNSLVPLHFACELRIKADRLPENLQDKVMLAQIDPVSGKILSATGKYEHGWVEGNIRTLGNYTLAVDTVAPKIVPLIFNEKKELKDPNSLKIKVADNLSGIETYRGTIDGAWVLFEFDQKNNLLSYTFDKSRFHFNSNHTLVLEVTDNKGNTSTYKTNFKR